MQAQRNDATVSAARAAALEADNAALARRLVELKEAEIERMNDINRQGEEMVSWECIKALRALWDGGWYVI